MMPVYSDTNSLSQEDMNAMVFVNNTGIIKGEGQFFGPNAVVTRGELVQVVSRCINLMAINEDYNGKEYELSVGQSIIIALPSNPTTGFCWIPGISGEDGIVTEAGSSLRLKRLAQPNCNWSMPAPGRVFNRLKYLN